MNTVTSSLIILAALPLLALPVDEVSIEYRAGQVIERTDESRFAVRLGETSMTVNDQSYPTDSLRDSMPDRDDFKRRVSRDTLRDVEAGRPTRLQREFVELSRELVSGDVESEEVGRLEGRTILLELNEDGEVELELTGDDEDEVEELYLTGHRMTDKAFELLPTDDVEPGETWTPDDEIIRDLLGSSGAEYFKPSSSSDFEEMLKEDCELVIEAIYKGLDEQDGTQCQVVLYEVSFSASLDELPESWQTEGTPRKTGGVEVEGEMSMEMWISTETNIPVRSLQETELDVVIEMHMHQNGAAIEIEFDMQTNGSRTITWELIDSDK